ncbi:MAG TPA: SdrD B-like domain-containing protein [Thermoanaerobaculia bacterium]|nr:SdrD B-like domain-containing protein [Thermoanaerobaculia bacterium]
MTISTGAKIIVLVAAVVFGLAAIPQAKTAQQNGGQRQVLAADGSGYHCLPSCSAADGLFLVIASGAGLVTLSDEDLDIELAVPAGTTSFQVGLFDGDSGGVDGLLQSHWDFATNIPYSYTLYADPLGDGSGSEPVDLEPGAPSVSSSALPDNDWLDFTVATAPAAVSPGGDFFYRLHIELLNSQVASFNSFKLRTTGIAMILPQSQPFSYMASMTAFDDARIIYPSYPALTPTTYDGTFRFFFSLLGPQTEVSVWDGDFDRGKSDGTELDTDDPDTPNGTLPSWVRSPDAVAEGVSRGISLSTGNPPDDDQTYSIFLRTPSVRSELHTPDSQVFADENPSGNQEWEQLRISTDPFDRSQMDYAAASLPGGTYELRVLGVDLSNLNAVRLPGPVLCVSETFEPCSPLFPFQAGGTVFRDLDADGVQAGSAEAGIAGVAVELLGTAGTVIATTTTDAGGNYAFDVPAGSFTVRVAAGSSDPGGPLDGAIATTPVQRTETVVDGNVLTFDFGYRGTASVGDRVWNDQDGDQVQDADEHGINGATVQLYDATNNLLATATTNSRGNYSFSNLWVGTYTVMIVTSTLPSGMSQTYGLDGLAASHASLIVRASRSDVDFGYRRKAAPR